MKKRNIGKEILQGIKELKTGETGRVTKTSRGGFVNMTTWYVDVFFSGNIPSLVMEFTKTCLNHGIVPITVNYSFPEMGTNELKFLLEFTGNKNQRMEQEAELYSLLSEFSIKKSDVRVAEKEEKE